MCQNRNPHDPDDIEPREYALTTSQGLIFHVELQFGPVEKARHHRLARELQRQLQEIMQDGRLTIRIDDDYFAPLSVDVTPVE